MGQQQLLLLILGLIVAGVAVVAGIQAFATNQKKHNIDALSSTSLRLATEAQVWLKTPSILGGGIQTDGTRPDDFTGITLDLEILGYEVNGAGDYQDVHGDYTAVVSGSEFIITAVSATSSGAGDNNLVCTVVSGATSDKIVMTFNPSSGSCS